MQFEITEQERSAACYAAPARASMNWPVTRLSAPQRAALERHLLSLEPEDRRMRFCGSIADTTVRDYVAHLDFANDAVFGVFDEEQELLGAAHVAFLEGLAELGVSVLRGQRNRGVGSALFARAVLHARHRGVGALLVRCLSQNSAMVRMATKQGMHVADQHDEALGRLDLLPSDGASRFDEGLARSGITARSVISASRGGAL